MSAIRTAECDSIERVIHEEIAPGIDAECQQEFDTKVYTVWLTAGNRSHAVHFSMETYQDNCWKQVVQVGLEELNASMPG